jgi:hypothetical protein
MLEPNFDPVPTAVQIGRCGYPVPCRAPRCAASHATIVLRKIDAAGRPVRQIELCDRHADAVIAREQTRGLEIFDAVDHNIFRVGYSLTGQIIVPLRLAGSKRTAAFFSRK